MNKAELLAMIPDHKSVSRYVHDKNGERYMVFGMTEDKVLVHRCVGNVLKRLSYIGYDDISHVERAVDK